ncbi:MAG: ATP-grasp domain-containing protein [Acidimicrobiia bacterium]
MRIAFLMVAHPPSRVSPIMPAVVQLLRDWGVEVAVVYPEEERVDLGAVRVEHDLYVLKSGTELALSVAGVLDALGAVIINPYQVSVRCRDKIVATRILQDAGIPVPDTYVAGRPGELASLLEDGPLVIKPYRGSQGRGVRVIWDADELHDGVTTDGPLLAQRYHQPVGPDCKVYCIGGQLFGVKRVWPARTYREKLGEPFTITAEIRDIAVRAGAAFGLGLFGFDVIMAASRPYVVDISAFPGFKGVPDAPLRLADYIYTAAERAAAGRPLVATGAPA